LASGGSFLVYPVARSSVRLERTCDAIETFDKICRLLERAARPPAPDLMNAPGKLDEALGIFAWPRGSQPDGHAEDVRRANEIELQAERMVR
jgi:hypothetical protein